MVSATIGTIFHQRGHAVPAALCMALRARGSVPNITALHRLWICWSVSSQGGVPPWLKSTRLTPVASGQRGHASRAALCTRALCATGGPPDITALWCLWVCCSVSGPGFARASKHQAVAWLWPAARSCRVRCLLFRLRCALQGQRTQHHRFSSALGLWLLGQWPRRGYRPGQATPSCRVVTAASVVHARYGHPLRFYIRPHFAKCSPVAALKLRLVSPTAARPHGFAKQALCKVAFAWVRAHSHRRFPVAGAPCAPPPGALLAAVAAGHWSGASRRVLASGLRPVMDVVLPRPPAGASPLRGIGPRAGCPSAPQGAPSVGAERGAATINCWSRQPATGVCRQA